MFEAFNIVILLLVGLIAYWWANQGLFSAILHLVCVIAAGAIALALWEPVTVGLLLRGTAFDNYAWGVSLIGMFVIVLVVLRVTMDKIIPGNVRLPQWANLVFGFPVGAAAGIITIGVFMIGAGFTQSTREIMGFVGHARSSQSARVEDVNALWVPVHEITANFYDLLSASSLYPTFYNTPMRAYHPELAANAASLHRDSFAGGRGKTSLQPSDATISRLIHRPDVNRYAVEVRFGAGARDYGEQLTLSSSQVQLIGRVPRGSGVRAKVAHPDEWTQYSGHHRFDDFTHYATSQAGQADATMLFEFRGSELGGQEPAFIMIRGTRFALPAKETLNSTQWASAGGAAAVATGGTIELMPGAPSIQAQVEQAFHIRPVSASVNQKPAGIELTERFISGGEGEFMVGGGRPSPKLEIQGIFEQSGTRIVQVDVSRGGPASLFDRGANESDRISLVDSAGRGYLPIGYIHIKPDSRVIVKVDLQNYVSTLRELPSLPTANTHKLKLLFAVTEGATVSGLVLGDVTIGSCSLLVKDPHARSQEENAGSGNFSIGG